MLLHTCHSRSGTYYRGGVFKELTRVLSVLGFGETHQGQTLGMMSSWSLKKMMEVTNQEGGGGELVSKSKQTFKTIVKKNFFCEDRITNFGKPILNQSPFTQKLLLKFFLPKKYFL